MNTNPLHSANTESSADFLTECKTSPAVDLNEAEHFLSAFGPADQVHCFAWLPEDKQSSYTPPGDQCASFAVLSKLLLEKNSSGAGIFFTPNECIGKRTTENVSKVRALFVDLDGAPIEPLRESRLQPHVIIESSRGRYHAYWRVDGITLGEFKKLQKQLANAFDGDTKVCDLPRIMRLPGFLHQKSESFKTRLVSMADGTYSAPEMREWLDELVPPPKPRAPMGGLHHINAPALSLTAESKIAGLLREIESSPEGRRNDMLNKAAHRIGRIISMGKISHDEMVEQLSQSAYACGLEEPEVAATIKSGLNAGILAGPDHEIQDADLACAHVEHFNQHHAIVSLSGKCRVANLSDSEDLTFSARQDIFDLYANAPTPIPKSAHSFYTEAELWWKHPNRREYDGIVFEPGAPAESGGKLNAWLGFSVDPLPGDCGLFWKLTKNAICSGDEIIFDYVRKYLAHMVQKPQELPEVAIVLKSGQGTGKGAFVETLGKLLHRRHYIMVNSQEQFTGRFNGHLDHKILVFVNEAIWGGNRAVASKLKSMISDKEDVIERKGLDTVRTRNFKRCIFASNSDWVVPIDNDDRRYMVLEIGNCYQKSHEFFSAFHAQMNSVGLAALLHELMTMDIAGFDPRVLPASPKLQAAALEQKMQNWDNLECWWHLVLNTGSILRSHNIDAPWPGLTAKLAIYAAYKTYCQDQNDRYAKKDNIFWKRLRIMCPAIDISRPAEVSGGPRPRAAQLPSLAACRQAFELYVGGEIEWDVQ
ncbi:MAG: DUF5906 domain-containing protein [Steroidobacteraceae bacterium]